LSKVEEVEWYGLSISEAKAKYQAQLVETQVKKIQPLKVELRAELIERLKGDAGKVPEESSSQPTP